MADTSDFSPVLFFSSFDKKSNRQECEKAHGHLARGFSVCLEVGHVINFGQWDVNTGDVQLPCHLPFSSSQPIGWDNDMVVLLQLQPCR